jgi:cytochrome c-type biogenesis protein CcmH
MIRLVFVQWPLILLLLGLCAVPSYQFDQRHKLWASEALVEFSDPELQRRYYQLVEELRCPKCQNQNLADSNAPISADMKSQIHLMLEEHKSDRQIKDHLVSRYSEFILYKPEVNQNTWFLWLAPVVIVLLGVLIVYRQYRSVRGVEKVSASPQLTVEQQQRLSALLDRDEDKS